MLQSKMIFYYKTFFWQNHRPNPFDETENYNLVNSNKRDKNKILPEMKAMEM